MCVCSCVSVCACVLVCVCGLVIRLFCRRIFVPRGGWSNPGASTTSSPPSLVSGIGCSPPSSYRPIVLLPLPAFPATTSPIMFRFRRNMCYPRGHLGRIPGARGETSASGERTPGTGEHCRHLVLAPRPPCLPVYPMLCYLVPRYYRVVQTSSVQDFGRSGWAAVVAVAVVVVVVAVVVVVVVLVIASS